MTEPDVLPEPVEPAPTGASAAAPADAPSSAPADVDAPALRPRRAKKKRRTRTLLIIGGAIVLVLALIAGVLVATNLDAQAAADELRAAEAAETNARSALRTALDHIETAGDELEQFIAASDAGLALTGAGIDEAAHAAAQTARDDAAAALEEDREPNTYDDARVTPDGDSDRDRAAALEAQTKLLTADAQHATAQAARLDDAHAALATAIRELLAASETAGAALLAEHTNASDATKARLQAQLDALTTSEPTGLADTLTAYRAAIDAVVESSKPDLSSITAVINKRRGLPADYVPAGLVTPSGIPGATQVRQELIGPLEEMRAAMAAEGITLRMSSAYRSYARQQTIYNGFVASQGVAGADTHSARPGNSEHQTGLVVDLDDGTGCNLSRCFTDAPGGRWLAANSWKYGFILRYPDGLQHIVGYTFEPWHFRYIGVDVATQMHNNGTRTLEEHFGLPAAPDYG